jgi:type I restriction-modification system DNA methylase subunit
MRRKLIDTDMVECVLGLGPNLFYNSPMEACVVICRTVKPKTRKGRILLINAVNEVTRERAQSLQRPNGKLAFEGAKRRLRFGQLHVHGPHLFGRIRL